MIRSRTNREGTTFKLSNRVRVRFPESAHDERTGTISWFSTGINRGTAVIELDGDPLPTRTQSVEELRRIGVDRDRAMINVNFLRLI